MTYLSKASTPPTAEKAMTEPSRNPKTALITGITGQDGSYLA